jgi:hypothetical protein
MAATTIIQTKTAGENRAGMDRNKRASAFGNELDAAQHRYR